MIYLLAAVIVAIGIVLFYRQKMKRLMKRIDVMIETAMTGSFEEELYDESMLSSVEAKLAKYLSASAVSARNLLEEKEKIKELIADISHQTKTPIANLLLYAQLLQEQELDEKSGACVEALNIQAQKLNFLIDSLVKVSRLEAGVIILSPKESRIETMLQTVLSQVKPKAESKEIQITLEPCELTACFDEKWTTEAIYNIVDNAVKYTPQGGQVKISARMYDLFLRIDIADTGIGIAEEEQSKIFGRFYRGMEVRDMEGVGIGLYLTRQIISEEGGYIKVQSAGEGTTFSVFLPNVSKL